MSDRTDALVQTLFNKPSLQACSRQQVDYLAHQYPYFSTAQLLLLQKVEPDPEAYAGTLQRTALHFSNPLQLHFWLNPEVFETELPPTEVFENPIPEAETAKENTETVAEPEVKEAVLTANSIPEEPKIHSVIPEAIPEPAATTSMVENTAEPETAAITFEPYHTVDYFASQGIKLSQQEASNDTLGKQVKSFTEWLKTMKRLPEKTAVQSGDTAGERKVENLAAYSLEAPDVVTESMAEVWLKQGNKEKARELYRKLSLRNPSKSAYFAAKIESIKKD